MLLGVQDLKTVSDGTYQRIKVESAEVHEKYGYVDGTRGYYDIAVLILKSDIKYNSLSVQPICLPYQANNQQDYWDDKTGVITGYAHQGTIHILRNHLQGGRGVRKCQFLIIFSTKNTLT